MNKVRQGLMLSLGLISTLLVGCNEGTQELRDCNGSGLVWEEVETTIRTYSQPLGKALVVEEDNYIDVTYWDSEGECKFNG